jgi:hypothetical protein
VEDYYNYIARSARASEGRRACLPTLEPTLGGCRRLEEWPEWLGLVAAAIARTGISDVAVAD